MADHEQQPNKLLEFKLVVPSLPVPHPGIFEEVYADFVEDADRFHVAVAYRMEQDTNPHLRILIDTSNPFNSLTSTKWPAIYYEIFSRSARKQGYPLLHINSERGKAHLNTEILKGMHALQETDSTLSELIEKDKANLKNRRSRDEALSPELVKFWNMIDQDLAMRREDGANEADGMHYLLALGVVQALMQKQDDEYFLAQHYISS